LNMIDKLTWAIEKHLYIKAPHDAAPLMEALRQELAKPEQEPFAYANVEAIEWFLNPERGDRSWATYRLTKKPNDDCNTPLYTAPPRKPWVNISSERLAQLTIDHIGYPTRLAAAIADELKELNAVPTAQTGKEK